MFFKYSKTLDYFGEDEKKIQFDEFFSIWESFIEEFKKIKITILAKKQQINNTLSRSKAKQVTRTINENLNEKILSSQELQGKI